MEKINAFTREKIFLINWNKLSYNAKTSWLSFKHIRSNYACTHTLFESVSVDLFEAFSYSVVYQKYQINTRHNERQRSSSSQYGRIAHVRFATINFTLDSREPLQDFRPRFRTLFETAPGFHFDPLVFRWNRLEQIKNICLNLNQRIKSLKNTTSRYFEPVRTKFPLVAVSQYFRPSVMCTYKSFRERYSNPGLKCAIPVIL